MDLHEALKELITFKHFIKSEVHLYINELSRRFNFPVETLIKTFEEEGFDV